MRKLPLAAVFFLWVLTFSSAQAAPTVGPCTVFPADNPWNMDISTAPVHPNSANYIANINAHGTVNQRNVHPDFGETPEYGIPWITVDNSQPGVNVSFEYDDESDPGPYPIPTDVPIEGGEDADGDRHVIVINTDTCMLYELFYAYYEGGDWSAGSGAIFDLNSNALRTEGWTSADAAGLPIFPGLARCSEVMAGEIEHALRFTVKETQMAYVYPARHYASENTGVNYPPMGLRLRLKANYDLSGVTGQSLVIATALKRYGMILADNGTNWYISGEADQNCWDDEDLEQLKDIPGTAFEVVRTESLPNEAPQRNYYATKTPKLTWNRISGANGYELQISLNNAFTGAPIVPVPANSLSFTPAPLGNGIYFWRVRTQGSPTWGLTQSFVVYVV